MTLREGWVHMGRSGRPANAHAAACCAKTGWIQGGGVERRKKELGGGGGGGGRRRQGQGQQLGTQAGNDELLLL